MDTKAFFGEQGLSSTSANYYANLAKEVARRILNTLANVRFYSSTMSIIGENGEKVFSRGWDKQKVNSLENSLSLLTQLHSLIAFFREAIKEKERLGEEAKNYLDVDLRKLHQEKQIEFSAHKPVRDPYLTEEDVVKTWTIGEQEKYLSLQTEAAVYGKFVHEDGFLSNARQDMMRILENPVSMTEKGRDTVIYTYEPTVDTEIVDSLYFTLQAHQRQVQAELNGMKKRIQDTLEANRIEVDEKYLCELQRYNAEMDELGSFMSEITEKESQQRKKLAQEVQNLKIVVPNRLKAVFDSLQEAAEEKMLSV